ncbi:MAG: hypothetical protein Q8O76_13145, partial [Chloroflexota bacterium]|nr:hypothetical protein [Chloroflexota bacterium]
MSYLSLIVFLPLIGALVIALLPSPSGKQVKGIAAVFTLVVFILSLAMALSFRPGQQGMQFVERADWIPQIGIHYFLGVDGISLPLVVLT